jgi:hypothetical protein
LKKRNIWLAWKGAGHDVAEEVAADATAAEEQNKEH